MSKKKSSRKIAVVTGTRAEYGLLRELLLAINHDSQLELQLIVTGMHLSPEFGLTYQQIESDGFYIDAKVEILLSSDTGVGVAKSVGVGVIGFADAFNRLQPNLIVVLGDRFEILAAAQAALFLKIPVAHIHGGELSVGALDDSIRHSITKMAHLHFTAAEVYKNRVIQLGENPRYVFNVGAAGLERIKKFTLLDKSELEAQLNKKLNDIVFLVTYHPETATVAQVETQCHALFAAIDAFLDASVIITRSNADEAGRRINQCIDVYARKQKERITVMTTMGDINYLSAMNIANVVIGNSSSGIIEAPGLKTATVNIGCRQDGRLRAASVIDCVASKDAIYVGIQKALSDSFQKVVNKTISPYDAGDSSKLILQQLKSIEFARLIPKLFYDISIEKKEPIYG